MTDLFDLPESLSPRLAWMRDHGITVDFIGESEFNDDSWICQSTAPQHSTQAFGFSEQDEDAAITDWARKNNVKLWNEA